MKKHLPWFLLVVFSLVSAVSTAQIKPDLGTVASFTVMANTSIANQNNTEIIGNVGLYPGVIFTGFRTGMIKGKTEIATAAAAKAQSDLVKAYNSLQNQSAGQNLSGQNLGGKTLTPGIYRLNAATLSGDLTLNNAGNADGVFIFQIEGNLIVAPGATVKLAESAKPRIQNIFWQVKSTSTLGEGSTFRGSILAFGDIDAQGGTLVQGRLLTSNGKVTLAGNQISFPADLSVSMTKSPGIAAADIYFVDENITFTINAGNLGPIGESNVRIRNILPPGLTYLSSSASVSTYDAHTNTWTIPDFPSGATETLKIVAKVNANATEFVVNTATIAGDGFDEILVNNSASVSNICVAPANPGVIEGPPIICSTSADNIFSVTPISGVRRYNWVVPSGWSIISGQNTPAIKVKAGSSAGTVSLTVENVCAYSNPSKKNVTVVTPVKEAPVAANQVKATPCAGETGITYAVNPIAQASTYAWTVPSGWVITGGQGTPVITVSAGQESGFISVAGVNICGQGPETRFQVTPITNQLLPPTAISGNTKPCLKKQLEYQTNILNGATSYLWEVPAGWTIISGNNTSKILVEVGNAAGNISVRAVYPCGTSSAQTLAVAPITNPPALPGTISGDLKVCPGERNLLYVVAAVAGASSYVWKVPAGWSITAGQGTPAITVTAGAASGNISVAADNGCALSNFQVASIEVQAAVPEMPGSITGSKIGCGNLINLTYTVPAVAGATAYTWYVPADWRISGQGTPTITVTAGITGGEIAVVAENSCGVSPPQRMVVAFSAALPAQPGAIVGNKIVCVNQANLVYTVPPASNADAYTWSVPAGWQIVSGQGTAAINVRAGNTAGSGNITVKAVNNCGTGAIQTLPVSVNGAVPVVPAAISGSATVCPGQNNITYSVAAVAGAGTYTWSVPDGWNITTGQGTPTITVTAGNMAGGNMRVTVSNSCGTSSPRQLQVAIDKKPAAPGAVSGLIKVCEGTKNINYKIPPVTGAIAYTWAVPADWVITAGQGTASIMVTVGKEPGNIKVMAGNNCGNSDPAVLPVAVIPALPVALGVINIKASAICRDQPGVEISINPVAAAETYKWTLPPGWVITSGAGTNIITVTAGVAGGVISVKAKNSCGESPAGNLEVNPLPTAPLTIGAVTGETLVCSNLDNLVYSVPPVLGATRYTWMVPDGWIIKAGQGTTAVTLQSGRTAGLVSVVAANDCASSAPASLNIHTTITPAAPVAITDLSTACTGLAYAVEDKNITDPEQPLVYNWIMPDSWVITSGQGTKEIKVVAPPNSLKNTIRVEVINKTCASPAATLMADPTLGEAGLTIANVFSPNGDGVNDTWAVTNLLNYPDNELVVINRWGNEVYQQKSYRNNWNGGELNAGTYYYVLKVKVCDGSYKTYKGYVMIMR